MGITVMKTKALRENRIDGFDNASSINCLVMFWNSGIQPFLLAYPQDAISLQLCTPKVVGV
jgi:hypothetical protein